VLVVGTGQSGTQIAEELYQSGKKVYLSIGSAGRVPRRYRGRDINDWFTRMGMFDMTVSELKSPRAKFAPHPQISGKNGGESLNLHEFARDGVLFATGPVLLPGSRPMLGFSKMGEAEGEAWETQTVSTGRA
jgi:putative flavoprotein involved in K+ transport